MKQLYNGMTGKEKNKISEKFGKNMDKK